MANPFPIRFQKGNNDCGLACMMMLAEYFRLPVSSSDILQKSHVSARGMSVYDFCSTAEQIGLKVSPVRSRKDELESISLPAIAFWNGNHFIAVYRVSTRYVWVADPAIGKVRYRKDEFQQSWYLPGEQAGVLLVMEPKTLVKRDKSI